MMNDENAENKNAEREREMNVRDVLGTLVGSPPRENPWCIVAEFESPAELVRAARALRLAGYRRFDTHTPFPIHGMNEAMGVGRSRVPFVVFAGGAFGLSAALLMQWWMNAVDYPYVVSDKPFFSLPAFIPVMFEMTVLFAAFAAVLSMLMFNFLPMLYHPLLKHERFARATDDGFLLSIEARDAKFDPEATRALLQSLGGSHITLLEP